MLEELLKDNPELEMSAEQGQIQTTMGLFVQNLMKEAGVPPPADPGQGQGQFVHEQEQGGPLEAKEPRSQVYDEWDFRADDYKPKWCIVREKGGRGRRHRLLQRHHPQLLIPLVGHPPSVRDGHAREFRKERRVIDGEDLDLDAAIEAQVDRRSGITPNDKVGGGAVTRWSATWPWSFCWT